MTSRDEHIAEPGLRWPELLRGTLILRYQRFLADVQLDDGRRVTAHCPNTGSMRGCCEPGRTVYLSHHNDPRRKLPFSWVLIEMPTSLVGVNTLVPNRLVQKAVERKQIRELAGYDEVRREVRVGHNSRIDLMLTAADGRRCFVEIKNCTLVENGIALFPDAVTSRGLKHVEELRKLVETGSRCVLFFCIQRMDARVFRPAAHIDPAYSEALRRAAGCGVETLAYDVMIDLGGIRLNCSRDCEI
jgi:sugar fermentation stimulation protein A